MKWPWLWTSKDKRSWQRFENKDDAEKRRRLEGGKVKNLDEKERVNGNG